MGWQIQLDNSFCTGIQVPLWLYFLLQKKSHALVFIKSLLLHLRGWFDDFNIACMQILHWLFIRLMHLSHWLPMQSFKKQVENALLQLYLLHELTQAGSILRIKFNTSKPIKR